MVGPPAVAAVPHLVVAVDRATVAVRVAATMAVLQDRQAPHRRIHLPRPRVILHRQAAAAVEVRAEKTEAAAGADANFFLES